MATLQIESILTEHQMNKVVKALDLFIEELGDEVGSETFEYTLEVGSKKKEVLVSVEMDSFCGEIFIKEDKAQFGELSAYVLFDWTLSKSDTLVLQYRLQDLIDNYNKTTKAQYYSIDIKTQGCVGKL